MHFFYNVILQCNVANKLFNCILLNFNYIVTGFFEKLFRIATGRFYNCMLTVWKLSPLEFPYTDFLRINTLKNIYKEIKEEIKYVNTI